MSQELLCSFNAGTHKCWHLSKLGCQGPRRQGCLSMEQAQTPKKTRDPSQMEKTLPCLPPAPVKPFRSTGLLPEAAWLCTSRAMEYSLWGGLLVALAEQCRGRDG